MAVPCRLVTVPYNEDEGGARLEGPASPYPHMPVNVPCAIPACSVCDDSVRGEK